ncbi:hypothetical protein [Pandoravirus japonicus]|uniref:Uncharacterized protein n=1 Tax=Pandoravirus japonicus TaxID=2823154 RepID=A0A811BSK2_9VIRU|nr:hypothetical protein [Pandoravirus japonicus]
MKSRQFSHTHRHNVKKKGGIIACATKTAAHRNMSTRAHSTDAIRSHAGPVSLPAELWWSIVGDVASTSTRDRLATLLTCRFFHAIVTERGDRAWVEYARRRGLAVTPARGETVESALRGRAEFGRCNVDSVLDVETCPLADVFASTPVVRVCRSASSRDAHDLVAFVSHLWPAATRSAHRRVALHGGVPDDRTLPAWHLPRARASDRDLLAIVDGDGSCDAALIYTGRHLGIVYFVEPGGSLPPSLAANVAATIIDGLGRNAEEMSRALCAVVGADLAPRDAEMVDLLAQRCCNKRALVLVYGRRYGDGIIVVSLCAAFYGALHPDDHVLVRAVHL